MNYKIRNFHNKQGGHILVVALLIIVLVAVTVVGSRFVIDVEEESKSNTYVLNQQESEQEKLNDERSPYLAQNEAATILGFTNEYIANNNGAFPDYESFITDVLYGNGSVSEFEYFDINDINIEYITGYTDPEPGHMYVVVGAACGDEKGTIMESTARSFVAFYGLVGSKNCIEG